MLYYWDTSALASILFKEQHSLALLEFEQKTKALLGFSSNFSELELESAFQRKLNRNEILRTEITHFRLETQSLLQCLSLIYGGKEVHLQSMRVMKEYCLRPGDALHLGSAVMLKNKDEKVSFLCLDKELCKAAQAEGLEIPFIFP